MDLGGNLEDAANISGDVGAIAGGNVGAAGSTASSGMSDLGSAASAAASGDLSGAAAGAAMGAAGDLGGAAGLAGSAASKLASGDIMGAAADAMEAKDALTSGISGLASAAGSAIGDAAGGALGAAESLGGELAGEAEGALGAAESLGGDIGGDLGGALGAAGSVGGELGGELGGALDGGLGADLAVGGAVGLGLGGALALGGLLGGGGGASVSGALAAARPPAAMVYVTGIFGTKVPKPGGQLVKAKFVDIDTGSDVLECLFNPETYKMAKNNSWGHSPSRGNLPQPHFGGGGPITVTIPLLWFDTYVMPIKGSPGTRDVRYYTDRLLEMMMIDPKKLDMQSDPAGAASANRPAHKTMPQGRPHLYAFVWGNSWSIRGAVTTLNIEYTMFDEDGTPVRAKVTNLALQQIEEGKYARQNPTSGGEPLRASRVVQAGDTLDFIAYQEYGDAGRWRMLARANGLENPRALRAGQRLIVPEP